MCAMLAAVDLLIVAFISGTKVLQQSKKANHVSRFLSWNLSTSQGSFESAFFIYFHARVSECVRRFLWLR